MALEVFPYKKRIILYTILLWIGTMAELLQAASGMTEEFELEYHYYAGKESNSNQYSVINDYGYDSKGRVLLFGKLADKYDMLENLKTNKNYNYNQHNDIGSAYLAIGELTSDSDGTYLSSIKVLGFSFEESTSGKINSPKPASMKSGQLTSSHSNKQEDYVALQFIIEEGTQVQDFLVLLNYEKHLQHSEQQVQTVLYPKKTIDMVQIEFCDKFNQVAVLLQEKIGDIFGGKTLKITYISMVDENGSVASTIMFKNIQPMFLPQSYVNNVRYMVNYPTSLIYEKQTNYLAIMFRTIRFQYSTSGGWTSSGSDWIKMMLRNKQQMADLSLKSAYLVDFDRQANSQIYFKQILSLEIPNTKLLYHSPHYFLVFYAKSPDSDYLNFWTWDEHAGSTNSDYYKFYNSNPVYKRAILDGRIVKKQDQQYDIRILTKDMINNEYWFESLQVLFFSQEPMIYVSYSRANIPLKDHITVFDMNFMSSQRFAAVGLHTSSFYDSQTQQSKITKFDSRFGIGARVGSFSIIKEPSVDMMDFEMYTYLKTNTYIYNTTYQYEKQNIYIGDNNVTLANCEMLTPGSDFYSQYPWNQSKPENLFTTFPNSSAIMMSDETESYIPQTGCNMSNQISYQSSDLQTKFQNIVISKNLSSNTFTDFSFESTDFILSNPDDFYCNQLAWRIEPDPAHPNQFQQIQGIFTNYTSQMLIINQQNQMPTQQITIGVSKDTIIDEKVAGEYTFQLTVYQLYGTLQLDIPITVTIIQPQQQCQILDLKLKSLTQLTASKKETQSNPKMYELEIGIDTLFTLNFKADLDISSQNCDPADLTLYPELFLIQSDNEKLPASQNRPVSSIGILTFNPFSRFFSLNFGQNITKAATFVGSYKFDIRYSLPNKMSVSATKFIVEINIPSEILQKKNMLNKIKDSDNDEEAAEADGADEDDDQQKENKNNEVEETAFKGENQDQEDQQADQTVFKGVVYKKVYNDTKQIEDLTEEEKTVITPVKMWIDSITRDGQVTIQFNQPLKIPNFKNEDSDMKLRRILQNNSQTLNNSQSNDTSDQMRQSNLDDIDMSDVFHISVQKIVPGSNQTLGFDPDDEESIKISPNILEWTSEAITISLNFDDPLAVSRQAASDVQDVLQVHIVNPAFFVSQSSNVQLELEQVQKGYLMSIPRQLPEGVLEQTLQDTAKKYELVLKILVITAAFFMKLGAQRLISLLMALQIISYMPLYRVDYPAELEIYIEAVRKVAEFDILPTEEVKLWMKQKGIIQVAQNQTQDQQLQGQSFAAAGFSSQPFENVLVFLLILGFVILVILIMVALMLIEKFRNKIKEKLEGIYKNMVWSGIIKSVMLTYLKNFVTFYLAVVLLIKAENGQRDTQSIVTTAIIGLPLVFFPIWSFIFLWLKTDMFDIAEFKQKFGGLYSDLHYNFLVHSRWCLFYPTLFTLRRVSFVLIAIIPFSYVYFNIVVLIVSSILYFAWLEHVKPFQSLMQMRLEAANEMLLLSLFYHMLCFTNLTQISSQVSTIQFSFLATILFLVALNLFSLAATIIPIEKIQTFLNGKLSKKTAEKIKEEVEKMEKEKERGNKIQVKEKGRAGKGVVATVEEEAGQGVDESASSASSGSGSQESEHSEQIEEKQIEEQIPKTQKQETSQQSNPTPPPATINIDRYLKNVSSKHTIRSLKRFAQQATDPKRIQEEKLIWEEVQKMRAANSQWKWKSRQPAVQQTRNQSLLNTIVEMTENSADDDFQDRRLGTQRYPKKFY